MELASKIFYYASIARLKTLQIVPVEQDVDEAHLMGLLQNSPFYWTPGEIYRACLFSDAGLAAKYEMEICQQPGWEWRSIPKSFGIGLWNQALSRQGGPSIVDTVIIRTGPSEWRAYKVKPDIGDSSMYDPVDEVKKTLAPWKNKKMTTDELGAFFAHRCLEELKSKSTYDFAVKKKVDPVQFLLEFAYLDWMATEYAVRSALGQNNPQGNAILDKGIYFFRQAVCSGSVPREFLPELDERLSHYIRLLNEKAAREKAPVPPLAVVNCIVQAFLHSFGLQEDVESQNVINGQFSIRVLASIEMLKTVKIV